LENERPAGPIAEPISEADNPAVHSYSFGPFRLDVTGRQFLRNDAVVPMTAKVFDTLLVLVRNHERAVGKEELIHAVWPNSFVSDDSLVQNISAIRRALGDDSSQPQYIVTLARRGYRFIHTVEAQTGAIAPATVSTETPNLRAMPAPAVRRPLVPWIAGAFAAGIVLALLVASVWRPTRPAVTETPLRFREVLPRGEMLQSGAVLSPDGRFLAFAASDAGGTRRLWVRSLKDSDSARALDGTGGALAPFWSPDSQHIGYYAGIHIKTIPVTGGTSRPIVTVQRRLPLGATWGADDQILYVDQGKILAVPASGGSPVIAADPSRTGPGELRWPSFLPDGRRFLFVVNSDDSKRSGTYLASLGSSNVVKLTSDAESPVIYAEPGYVLIVRDGVLIAQPFDASRGQLTGEPKTVLGDAAAGFQMSAARNGLLAVTAHSPGARAASFDRNGRELAAFKVPMPVRNITVSPNDKEALATSYEGGPLTLWKFDLDRNVATRLIANGGFPAWSPDGVHFAFISVGSGGAADLVIRSTAGSDQSVLLKSDDIKVVNDWSHDGRYIVFANNSANQSGLWVLPTSDHQPQRVQAHAHAAYAKLSPDGHWIVYVSDETGSPEVYVDSFPTPGVRQQVSTGGGAQPVWRGDGRELFYLSADHHVMALSIAFGGSVRLGKPQPLFSLPEGSPFAVTSDGMRIVSVIRERADNADAITILTDWAAVAK
jgi:Tol biopolymer transport system component/DNA-binding winged helix-turn-helix (wHTH) protein